MEYAEYQAIIARISTFARTGYPDMLARAGVPAWRIQCLRKARPFADQAAVKEYRHLLRFLVSVPASDAAQRAGGFLASALCAISFGWEDQLSTRTDIPSPDGWWKSAESEIASAEAAARNI